MKIITAFSAILIACLIVGCSDEESDEKDEEVSAPQWGLREFIGLPAMTVGSWAEHTFLIENQGERYRWEYIGADTIDGHDCFVLENETLFDGEKTVVYQFWIDVETAETILTVSKTGEAVTEVPSQEISEYAGAHWNSRENVAQLGVESYTTPAGKTVKAIVYTADLGQNASGKFWVSGDVPFGIVRSIIVYPEGEEKMVAQLYDFGFSGTVRDISKEEAEMIYLGKQ